MVVGVTIVLAMILTAYVLTNGFHGQTGSSEVVLVPAGTGYSLPMGQFSGTEFTATSASTISGTLNSSEGVQIYLMTPTQFEAFAKSLNVSGYVWTSGWVANESIYHLDIPVPAGQWVLAFTDPNAGLPTGVGIYTDIILKAA